MSVKRPKLSTQETRKIRKILNEEARLGLNTNSDSEKEDVDLKKDIYPLGHYINNREDMIEQMFSLVKGPRLEKMLPPILKDMPLDELKADCLIHLLGMSKKRILSVLDGKEINSSSDSELEAENSPSPTKKNKSKFIPMIIKQEGCSDISDNSEEVVLVDPDLEKESKVKKKSKKHLKSEESKSSKKTKKQKHVARKCKKSKETPLVKPIKKDVNSPTQEISSDGEAQVDPENPKEGKTLLEILELEMRARAIRALLNKGDDKKVSEEGTSKGPNITIENEEGEIDSNKVTPTKNLRKQNKDKSDDLILVSPKVVTIDLTDEHEALSAKRVIDAEHQIEELDNLLSSVASEQAEKAKEQCTENITNEEPEEANENSEAVNKSPVVVQKVISIGNNTPEREEIDEDEVISVTDSPKNDKTEEEVASKTLSETEEQNSCWARRWLDSDKVKKVVKTSKICGNIRKRIKSAKLTKNIEPPRTEAQETPNPPSQEIEGRVDEYLLLTKSQANLAGGYSKPKESEDQSLEPTNDSVDSILLQNPEETDIEQVQDVSSTKVDAVTEITSDLSNNEGKNHNNDSALGTSVNSSTQDTSCDLGQYSNVIVDSLFTQSNVGSDTKETPEESQTVNERINSIETPKESSSTVQPVLESEIENAEDLAVSKDSANSTTDQVVEEISIATDNVASLHKLSSPKVTQECESNRSVREEACQESVVTISESATVCQDSTSNKSVDLETLNSQKKKCISSVVEGAVESNEPETLEISIDDDDSDFE